MRLVRIVIRLSLNPFKRSMMAKLIRLLSVIKIELIMYHIWLWVRNRLYSLSKINKPPFNLRKRELLRILVSSHNVNSCTQYIEILRKMAGSYSIKTNLIMISRDITMPSQMRALKLEVKTKPKITRLKLPILSNLCLRTNLILWLIFLGGSNENLASCSW